jgi:hypothetical protein
MLRNQITPSKAQEAAEDVFFGQIVIIWARWFLIAAGAIITLWSAHDMLQLSVAILTLIVLMTMNFFTHARYLTGQPVNRILLLFANVLDMAIITVLVSFWNGQSGLNSNFFILYYPMLFSWALVFSPSITSLFSLITLTAYSVACIFTTDPHLMFSVAGFELLCIRLVTLGAMGGLGTYYYRRQRDSLRAALAARPQPLFR